MRIRIVQVIVPALLVAPGGCATQEGPRPPNRAYAVQTADTREAHERLWNHSDEIAQTLQADADEEGEALIQYQAGPRKFGKRILDLKARAEAMTLIFAWQPKKAVVWPNIIVSWRPKADHASGRFMGSDSNELAVRPFESTQTEPLKDLEFLVLRNTIGFVSPVSAAERALAIASNTACLWGDLPHTGSAAVISPVKR